VTALDDEAARLAPVRRRIARAKTGLVVCGALVFGAAMAFSRLNDPGHPKQRLRPLAASPRFFAIVRAHGIEPGLVMPALKTPSAATKQS
jgi:hypothetical protein